MMIMIQIEVICLSHVIQSTSTKLEPAAIFGLGLLRKIYLISIKLIWIYNGNMKRKTILVILIITTSMDIKSL